MRVIWETIAFAVDPTLGLEGLATLDEVMRTFQLSIQLGALAIVLITSAALVLSLAGIYSLMSFIVSQRTREIGICAALGARPGGIVKAILSRAAMQLGTGVVCGIGLTFMFHFIVWGRRVSRRIL